MTKGWLLAVASMVVSAGTASAQVGLSPEGVWVTAEARRLLGEGRTGDPGCHLVVAEGGTAVEEDCAEGRLRWPAVSVVRNVGAVEIRSEGADAVRRLVLRPGAPSELEVHVERDGERSFHRLYRLEPRHRPALDTLVLVRDRLLGSWETGDGVEVVFDGQGRYRFGGDVGRFRVEAGFVTELGAWAALHFEPEAGGPVRRYLVHGEGERLGLAEVPRDVDLLVAPPAPDSEPEVGDVVVVVEGVSIPVPGTAPAAGRVLPPHLEEPAPGIWLRRPVARDHVAAEAEPEEIEPPAEPPPIAQPIRPARSCGCAASEAGAFALILPAFWFARGRRR